MNKSKIIGIPVLSVLIGFGVMGYMNRDKEPVEEVLKTETCLELSEGEVLVSYELGNAIYSQVMTEEKFQELYNATKDRLAEIQAESEIVYNEYEDLNAHIKSMESYSGDIDYYCPTHESKHTELYYNAIIRDRNGLGEKINHFDFRIRSAMNEVPSISKRYGEE